MPAASCAAVAPSDNQDPGAFISALQKRDSMAEPARACPVPTPETQHFWDGTRAGELRLQRCDACAHVYFPPRPFCPSCASRKVTDVQGQRQGDALQLRHQPSPGRARLHAALRDCGGRARRRPAHDEQHHRLPADAGGARARHEARSRVREARRQDHPFLVFRPAKG